MGLASILGIRGARDKPEDSYGSTAYSFLFGRSSSGNTGFGIDDRNSVSDYRIL